MRILTYSDLHLEFGSRWRPPAAADGDLLILAGDIINLSDYAPLDHFLQRWRKPVLYVTGNHEYYTSRPMSDEETNCKAWLQRHHPHVNLLLDESTTIAGVNFFGGAMWTDFNGADPRGMDTAAAGMNDFQLIRNPNGSRFTPRHAIALHEQFTTKLLAWFATDLAGPRVVITHNAPVLNPRTKYANSPLWPAFNSLDMGQIIHQHQPALWVYGHTHECDRQTIGATRIISNQLGYPLQSGAFECPDFDPLGAPVDLGDPSQ